jgi:hypothetical protein
MTWSCLASTLEGLQRQINALASFCDLRQLTINLGKTKVLIFNASKSSFIDLHFYYRGQRLRSPQPILTWEYSLWGPVSVCDRSFIPDLVKGMVLCPHRETMLLRLVLGHLGQTLPDGGDYQAHSSLWLRDLGAEFVTDRLG